MRCNFITHYTIEADIQMNLIGVKLTFIFLEGAIAQILSVTTVALSSYYINKTVRYTISEYP
jgi:hypothetical protein